MRIDARPWRLIVFGAVWAVAVLVRAPLFHHWPIGFSPTVEFSSADATRTIFLALTSSHAGGWQQAWLAAHPGRFIEPPVLQVLTALTYLPGGVERPWTAAVFTTAFWFAGAALVFSAVHRLAGWWGAVVAIAFLLLAPFAVAVSQSFQPEALLVFGLGAATWYAVRGDVTQPGRLPIAAIIGGSAGLIKPGLLLPIIAAVFVFSAAQGGPILERRRLVRLCGLLVLVGLPAVLWAAVLLSDQVGQKILPGLLLTPAYFAGWWSNVLRVVGIVPLIGGVLGFVLIPRLRLLGLLFLAAYLVYSAVFTWHTMTHDYYQVPLLFIIAVGLGGLGEELIRRARAGSWRLKPVVATAIGLTVALTIVLAPPHLLGSTPGRYPNQARFEAIGRVVGAGEPVIAFSEYYGYPLAYYGKLIVANWPDRSQEKYLTTIGKHLSPEARLSMMISTGHPHYFVVAVPPGWTPQLVNFLGACYPVSQQGAQFRVYDLTHRLDVGTRPPAHSDKRACPP